MKTLNRIKNYAVLLSLIIVIGVVSGDITVLQVFVNDVTPFITDIKATDPIILLENSTVIAYCNATVVDYNGYQDIKSVKAILWNPNTTYSNSTVEDRNNFYINSNCNITAGLGTSATVYCPFTIYYYAEPSEWVCRLNVTDFAGLWNTSNKTDITLQVLKGVRTPNLIDYSTSTGSTAIAPGETSTQDVIGTIYNTGNVVIDLQVQGTSTMNCTIGFIPVYYNRYNTTANMSYSSMCSLTTSLSDTCYELNQNFDLNKTTTETPTSKNTYWKIYVPTTGISGTCSGEMVFMAI